MWRTYSLYFCTYARLDGWIFSRPWNKFGLTVLSEVNAVYNSLYILCIILYGFVG